MPANTASNHSQVCRTGFLDNHEFVIGELVPIPGPGAWAVSIQTLTEGNEENEVRSFGLRLLLFKDRAGSPPAIAPPEDCPP